MASVALALGSNVGDRFGFLQRAVDLLSHDLRIVRVAGVYETAPMYVTDQPAFLNSALMAETELGPLALLSLAKRVEREVGRMPTDRYGPREIDIDLVLYGALRYRYATADRTVLQIPHPALPDRRFVLQPLSDLGLTSVPGIGPLAQLLSATESEAAHVVNTNAELQVRR